MHEDLNKEYLKPVIWKKSTHKCTFPILGVRDKDKNFLEH